MILWTRKQSYQNHNNIDRRTLIVMGKGKKKKGNKGKKNGKKVRDDTGVSLYASNLATTPEQMERARLAAANRKEDPLKNWTRIQNEECPILQCAQRGKLKIC